MGSLKMTGCGDQNIKTSFNCSLRKKKKKENFPCAFRNSCNYREATLDYFSVKLGLN